MPGRLMKRNQVVLRGQGRGVVVEEPNSPGWARAAEAVAAGWVGACKDWQA
jgi:hypothetical protein